MKKIIAIMLCGAALTGFAGLSGISCSECSECGETETSCQIWFKGSGKGKISTGAKSQLYKTVKTLKVSSCQLIIASGGSTANVKVVVKGNKKGVGDFEKELECTEFAWNVFGKNISAVTSGSKKKDVSLDSEMFFKAEAEDGTMEIAGVLTGKVKAKVTGGSSLCDDTRSVKWTPGKFTGKFVGWSEATGCNCARELTASLADECDCTGTCLTFVEPEKDPIEVFDGTITLKYNEKNSGCRSRIITD